ncbi:protein-S-isoprenylcysteine O-methyltransferase Ste14 [Georgenia soli]|uniref:Protein-S-isoprenylcysteine O-methyltransferase Ste14 n=1 Tax=Georgenia soli TaxID=638953 RepID=A0A2A9EHT2_9MICO|nr:isoprenylcysteine carboxylmethyltransferase family protein [Georgenia soli]PFG38081.1 protein-S-isoprenylcysteine O-methyltransferase Ste14 [Georgenia soli]
MDRSDILVVAQAAALAGVLWPGGARWDLPVAAGAVASASMVAGGALAVVGAAPHTRLTPRVRPPAGAPLVTTGAYALTRNPIYVGLTAGAWGLAVLRRRPGPLVAAAVLTAVLTAKSRLEEGALVEVFGEAYVDYAARTPRLLGRRRQR